MLKEIIQEQTGCDNIELLVSEDYNSPYFSYIDHDSVDIVPRTDAFDKEYEKRTVKNNKILSWDERDELRKNIIKSNIYNEDMIYSITFTITKI